MVPPKDGFALLWKEYGNTKWEKMHWREKNNNVLSFFCHDGILNLVTMCSNFECLLTFVNTCDLCLHGASSFFKCVNPIFLLSI
jgi:hypothetical protein